MKERIQYGKNTPSAFREGLHFCAESPYTIRIKNLVYDDITPWHYSSAMELLVCCNASGTIGLESEREFNFSGNAAILIPPSIVHKVTIYAGSGTVYLLHVSFAELAASINIEAILAQEGKELANMRFHVFCDLDFDQIFANINDMILHDDSVFLRLRPLLSIMSIIKQSAFSVSSAAAIPDIDKHNDLKKLIKWTSENYANQITLNDAAAVVGFSKSHFCHWFKSITGYTYNSYLNEVRIHSACKILRQTGSLSSACYDCGFKDMSYFIQLFKKKQGCTPKKYIIFTNMETP